MALNHDEAIARVTVDGLAVARFNGVDTWDLVFLRLGDECHQLRLTMEREDGTQEEMVLDESVQLINFGTVNGHFPSGFSRGYFDNGEVNRKHPPRPGPETENFRWTIDLEDDGDVPHGFVALKERPEVALTRTFIHNAVFYTLNVSPEPLILVPTHVDPNPPNPPQPPFGRTNDEIAADIFCNPGGEVFIEVDGREVFRESHRPGNPWKICLTNLCVIDPTGGPPFRKGDFQQFYKVIDINGTPHALWGRPIPSMFAQCFPSPGPGVSEAKARAAFAIGRPDCDTTRLGSIGTLDLLF